MRHHDRHVSRRPNLPAAPVARHAPHPKYPAVQLVVHHVALGLHLALAPLGPAHHRRRLLVMPLGFLLGKAAEASVQFFPRLRAPTALGARLAIRRAAGGVSPGYPAALRTPTPHRRGTTRDATLGSALPSGPRQSFSPWFANGVGRVHNRGLALSLAETAVISRTPCRQFPSRRPASWAPP